MIGEIISIETLRIYQEIEKENKELQEENEKLKDSLETMTFTAKVKQEAIDSLIKRIDEAIGIANERVNFYHHIKDKEHLEEWKEIFDTLCSYSILGENNE